MKSLLEILCFILRTSWVSSTIDGLSYMDPLIQRPLKPYLQGEDPCNPLYWYPRHIPDYCFNKFKPRPIPLPPPLPPLPPVVVPQPAPPMTPMFPFPYPIPPPMPYPPPPIPIYPSAAPQFIPPHAPQYLSPTVPYGTAPMLPMASPPIMVPEMQVGLQPGLPGMVSEDGGINILPFSDAYSDMLEKHKQKIIRKKLQKILDDYDDYPRKRRYRKYRRGKYY